MSAATKSPNAESQSRTVHPVFSIDSGGHLRRYVTTLGIAIAAAAVFFGRTLLQAASVLTLPESDIRRLTPDAQRTIRRQQQLADHVSAVGPWVIAVVAAAGVGLAIWGLFGWSRIQRDEDEQRKLETQKKRAELRALTPEEKLSEKLSDAVDQLAANDGEKPVPDESASGGDIDVDSQLETVSASASRAFTVEETFAKRLNRSRHIAKVMTGRAVPLSTGHATIDVIGYQTITSGSESGDYSVLGYRIKYVSRPGPVPSIMLNKYIKESRATIDAGPMIDRITLVVVLEDATGSAETRRRLERVAARMSANERTRVRFAVIIRDDLESGSDAEFFKAIGLLPIDPTLRR